MQVIIGPSGLYSNGLLKCSAIIKYNLWWIDRDKLKTQKILLPLYRQLITQPTQELFFYIPLDHRLPFAVSYEYLPQFSRAHPMHYALWKI